MSWLGFGKKKEKPKEVLKEEEEREKLESEKLRKEDPELYNLVQNLYLDPVAALQIQLKPYSSKEISSDDVLFFDPRLIVEKAEEDISNKNFESGLAKYNLARNLVLFQASLILSVKDDEKLRKKYVDLLRAYTQRRIEIERPYINDLLTEASEMIEKARNGTISPEEWGKEIHRREIAVVSIWSSLNLDESYNRKTEKYLEHTAPVYKSRVKEDLMKKVEERMRKNSLL
jgi:hypothetical protein